MRSIIHNADGIIDQADYDEMNMSGIEWNLTSLRLAADFNGDRGVDDADIDILVAHWQQSVTPGTNGDANGDGHVTLTDTYIMHNQMGLHFAAIV